MRQYNIPFGGYIPVENVTYLVENDLNQINKIPMMRSYEGYAIVTVGPIYLKKDINIEHIINDNAIVRNKNNNIFLINCNHESLKNNMLAFQGQIDIDSYVEVDIDKYFSVNETDMQTYNIDEVNEELHEELKKYCYNGEVS